MADDEIDISQVHGYGQVEIDRFQNGVKRYHEIQQWEEAALANHETVLQGISKAMQGGEVSEEAMLAPVNQHLEQIGKRVDKDAYEKLRHSQLGNHDALMATNEEYVAARQSQAELYDDIANNGFVKDPNVRAAFHPQESHELAVDHGQAKIDPVREETNRKLHAALREVDEQIEQVNSRFDVGPRIDAESTALMHVKETLEQKRADIIGIDSDLRHADEIEKSYKQVIDVEKNYGEAKAAAHERMHELDRALEDAAGHGKGAQVEILKKTVAAENAVFSAEMNQIDKAYKEVAPDVSFQSFEKAQLAKGRDMTGEIVPAKDGKLHEVNLMEGARVEIKKIGKAMPGQETKYQVTIRAENAMDDHPDFKAVVMENVTKDQLKHLQFNASDSGTNRFIFMGENPPAGLELNVKTEGALIIQDKLKTKTQLADGTDAPQFTTDQKNIDERNAQIAAEHGQLEQFKRGQRLVATHAQYARAELEGGFVSHGQWTPGSKKIVPAGTDPSYGSFERKGEGQQNLPTGLGNTTVPFQSGYGKPPGWSDNRKIQGDPSKDPQKLRELAAAHNIKMPKGVTGDGQDISTARTAGQDAVSHGTTSVAVADSPDKSH